MGATKGGQPHRPGRLSYESKGEIARAIASTSIFVQCIHPESESDNITSALLTAAIARMLGGPVKKRSAGNVTKIGKLDTPIFRGLCDVGVAKPGGGYRGAFTAARDYARAAGHIEAETICSHNLASTHLREGETRPAIELYQQALDVCGRISHRAGEAATHHRLGDAYRQDGQYGRSAEHYRRALSLREHIGHLRGQGKTHNGLSRLYLETGKTAAAAVHCQLALRIHEQTKDEAPHCDALVIMAEIRQATKSASAAMMDIRSALTIAERIGDSYRKAQALTVLADILIASGSPQEAAGVCATALRISDNLEGSNVPRLRDRLHRLRAASLSHTCAS